MNHMFNMLNSSIIPEKYCQSVICKSGSNYEKISAQTSRFIIRFMLTSQFLPVAEAAKTAFSLAPSDLAHTRRKQVLLSCKLG